jgi:lipopolysaccharide/colanic/teichoic acid biosynthesis glycosyltransferase
MRSIKPNRSAFIVFTTSPKPNSLYTTAFNNNSSCISNSADAISRSQDCFNTIHISAHSQLKRCLDIAGSLLGLMITAILFIPLAIAIQIDNPGPIFYGQTRCGINGKPFTIWKFRSMTTDADQQQHLVKNEAQGHIFKSKADPRVTRVGRFIRKTSLDEFPQFWNVLKGEMSLVGTRPPTPNEVAKYSQHHWIRLRVKPGMTGEWQVNGRSNVSNFEDIVKMDVAYQDKWSNAYDLMLIFRTIAVVMNKHGAF